MRRLAVETLIAVALVTAARAANLGVTGRKLLVLDKLAIGTAKVVYVSKDRGAGITKGPGTDAGDIAAGFEVAYEDGSAAGAFVIPSGESDGTAGWLLNRATVAKYVNKAAPAGPTEARVAVVKPGRLLKLVGRGLGDAPLALLAAGSPLPGGVRTAYCIRNGGVETCHCSHFTDCAFTPVAGGTGAKLVCRDGGGDPSCAAHVTTTTTTTTSTTSSTSTSTTLAGVSAIACCQGDGECADAPGFSLFFYLYQYCGLLPPSDPVPGGACTPSGDCQIQSFPATTLCCQLQDECYQSGGPVTDTGTVWSFRNYCVGANLGTVYAGVCGPEGTCVAE
jgi:hypothetical protein